MNFENEFDHLVRARNLLMLQSGISVPKPIRRLSSRRVLVMEVLPGENIDTLITKAEEGLLLEKAKMYERVLKSFLYQVVVLGELHGDMHPGNILATESGHLGLIDWAHVFKSRGMVSYPAKSLYYAITGQPDKFVETFLKMNLSQTFPVEEFTAKVMNYFEKAKIPKTSLSQLVLGKASDHMDPALDIFQNAIRDAVKMGFKVTPAYLQFLRTAMPVTSTLAALGREIPKEVKSKISKSALIWVYPSGLFQATVGKSWHLLTTPQRAMAKRISDYLRQHDLKQAAMVRAGTCRLLFASQ